MNEKDFNNIIKLMLIVSGVIILTICLLLYLGDEEMRKGLEYSIWFKIGLIAFSIAIIAMFFMICATMFCSKSNDVFIASNCEKGYFLIKENFSSISYDNLDFCLKNADNNDFIVCIGKDVPITSEQFVFEDSANKQKKTVLLAHEKYMPVFRLEVKSETVKCENCNKEQDGSQ